MEIVVTVLIALGCLLVGVLIGMLATRAGFRHNPPAPPKPPGRHASRRPDGGPERRQDYLEPAEEAVTGPMVVGRAWGGQQPAQPETREMGAVRPSPQQDLARWKQQQEEGGG